MDSYIIYYQDEKIKDLDYSFKTDLKRVSWHNNLIYRTYITKIYFRHEGANLGVYECVFTVSDNLGKKYIEDIKVDLNSSFTSISPNRFEICKATLIDEDYNIIHRFNIYKQHASLHNKRLVLALSITTNINNLEEQ